MPCRRLAVVLATAFLMLTGSAQAAVLHVSPVGTDDGDCTTIAPCETFGRAYEVAAPGDTVEVAGGRYGNQRLADDDYKDHVASEAVFRPALGAQVTITDLLTFASNVRFVDFNVDGSDGGQPDIRGGHN